MQTSPPGQVFPQSYMFRGKTRGRFFPPSNWLKRTCAVIIGFMNHQSHSLKKNVEQDKK